MRHRLCPPALGTTWGTGRELWTPGRPPRLSLSHNRGSTQSSGGKRPFWAQENPVVPTFSATPGSCEPPAGSLGLGPCKPLSPLFIFLAGLSEQAKLQAVQSLSSWVRQSQIQPWLYHAPACAPG